MMLTGMIQWGMRQSAEMENLMTSVERVMEYGRIESEAELKTSSENLKVEDSWPTESAVLQFENVWLKYGEDENYVLKGLNFETKPREKASAETKFILY